MSSDIVDDTAERIVGFSNRFLSGLGLDVEEIGPEKFLSVLMTSLREEGLVLARFHGGVSDGKARITGVEGERVDGEEGGEPEG